MGILLDLIFPPRCLICRTPLKSGYICGSCLTDFVPVTGAICKRCGVSKDRCTCGALVNNYDGCVASLYFEKSGKTLVYRCKNASSKSALKLAACFMETAYRHYYPKTKIDVMICIPRDFYKYLRDGENHSDVLGKYLSKKIKIKYDGSIIKKVKLGKTQKRLTKLERLENLHGAYKVFAENKVKGKNVLIIDDVKTTGATLNECAKVLKAAGASRVYCLVLASVAK